MSVATIITYVIVFLAVYVQVFFLVTLLEKHRELAVAHRKGYKLTNYPSVAIIMPCWNEEKTAHGTVESLLALEYPPEKLEIIIVDDGSTDSTWQEVQQYKGHPQIKIFHKENGGKHTAVNFGISQTSAQFIGCLDADSFVAPDALARIISVFQERPETMAVAPAVIIHRPQNLMQKVQKVEYNMGLYLKKMQAMLGAIHVTPGPFSIFRREVFEKLGGFRKAHNTEDMEIAFRMQEAHMKIEHCHTAQVYTVAPDTVKKLYKQRTRWIYGFIQNAIDYRHLIFRKKYGHFALFTVPAGIISICAAMYLFFSALYNLVVWIAEKVVQWRAVGLSAPRVSFDWFYINTGTIVFVTATLYLLLITAILLGGRLAKQKFSWHIVSYMVVYSIIAPFWLMKAIWSSLRAKQPNWR